MNGPTISQLLGVQLSENGEPLVDLHQVYPELLCEYCRKNSGVSSVLVRKAVADKLYRVQAHLPCVQLVVVEGYRSLAYQARYFREQLKNASSRTLDEALEWAHSCVAHPLVAGHPTGGAVDVKIASAGHEIDMGCGIADFSDRELLPTFSDKVTPAASRYRRLLHDAMVQEGFAPFYGEWWHFSYGDREWALFYRKSKTIYAGLTKISR